MINKLIDKENWFARPGTTRHDRARPGTTGNIYGYEWVHGTTLLNPGTTAHGHDLARGTTKFHWHGTTRHGERPK